MRICLELKNQRTPFLLPEDGILCIVVEPARTNVCACFFSTFSRFSPAPVGLFSRSRLRDTEGARLYTTAQVWVPGGLRDACCGRSKSRNLASIHGVAFRGARAEQGNGKPTYQLFCSAAVKAL